jgi:hypothetical protein
MSNTEEKTRPPMRTLRMGTASAEARAVEACAPVSERRGPRSVMRPSAPAVFPAQMDEPGIISSTSGPHAAPQPPHARGRLRTPMEEVNDLLRDLELNELGDVLQYTQRLLAARGKGPDPEVVTSLLAVMARLHPAYRNTPGVPLPILRGALVEVPRRALDEALRVAEARMLLRLLPVSPVAPFVERAAGIHDARRGLLYYCTTPGARD